MGYVRVMGNRSAALSGDLIDDFLRRVLLRDVVDHDVRSRGPHGERHSVADSRIGTRERPDCDSPGS